MTTNDPAVIVFDGHCNLCSATVDFVARRDPGHRFRLAASQSPAGASLLARHGIDAADPSTVYLVESGRVSQKSTAALRIARGLKFPWSLAYAFILVPRPLRDAVYKLVAGNRYRWFGRREACRLATAEDRGRFLKL